MMPRKKTEGHNLRHKAKTNIVLPLCVIKQEYSFKALGFIVRTLSVLSLSDVVSWGTNSPTTILHFPRLGVYASLAVYSLVMLFIVVPPSFQQSFQLSSSRILPLGMRERRARHRRLKRETETTERSMMFTREMCFEETRGTLTLFPSDSWLISADYFPGKYSRTTII
jgi:hypothetical protein